MSFNVCSMFMIYKSFNREGRVLFLFQIRNLKYEILIFYATIFTKLNNLLRNKSTPYDRGTLVNFT